MSVKVSIVTPWLDQPQLVRDYEFSVAMADEVIVVDNGSTKPNWEQLVGMVKRLKGVLIPRDTNGWFSGPVNEGLAVATGDVIVVLNNDIQADPRWVQLVRNDARPEALLGPSGSHREVDGMILPYIEGWCVGASQDVWRALHGFDADTFVKPYWEDVDLSFRAMAAGMSLYLTKWPIRHLSNTTSRAVPGAYDESEENGRKFVEKVRAYRKAAA